MTDNNGSSSGQLPKLDTGNFTYWYDALEIHARTIEADNQLVAPHTASPDPATEATHQKKLDLLRKAIMQSLTTDVIRILPPHVLRYDPHTICRIIRNAVDSSSTENHEILDAEARSIQFHPGTDATEYVNKHRELRYRMQVAKYPNIADERTTVRYMLQGLNHHPDMGTLAIVMAGQPPQTIQSFTNHVQQVQLMQAQTQTQQPRTSTYVKRNRSAQRPNKTRPAVHTYNYPKPKGHQGPWCAQHGSMTHNTAQCYARRQKYHTAQASARVADTEDCETGNQHSALQTMHERLAALEASIHGHATPSDGKSHFILDSGANPTHTARPHATMQRSTGTLTKTATGQCAPITHTGCITIAQKNKKLKVPAVHTPQIKENLLSVHDLAAHGHVTFSRTNATLHKPVKLPPALLTAKYHNGQYRFTQQATAKGARTFIHKNPVKRNTGTTTTPITPHHAPTTKTRHSRSGVPINTQHHKSIPISLRNAPEPPTKAPQSSNGRQQMHEWHLKLNHMHPKTIAHMSKHQLLPGLPPGLKDHSATMTCSGCIDGKTAKRPHRRTTHDTIRGDSLSSDVCGPIKPTSTHNANYFLTVIDTKTRYIWVHCINNRAQVPHTIINAIDQVATENGQQPSLLVTDNAKEYLAKQVQYKLRERGIKYRATTPYTPQENSLAERINRTLMEKVRATLSHSKLHAVHWQDALHDAVYKYNITYHHSTRNIPHTQWYDAKPRVQRIFTFGQLGYTPILKPHLPKLHNKATPVRYMYGLDETHICVQDIQTRRYKKMRAIDFRAYHKHSDPCLNTTATYKAHVHTKRKARSTGHSTKRRTNGTRRPQAVPTKIETTTPPPKNLKQARQYPDATQWGKAHDAELEQLDAMKAIDWHSQVKGTDRRNIIPTTMTYRYKRYQNETRHKARCSIRGDRMTPNIHYDPDKTATYMADRTTIRTLFALAASRQMVIEHFDISGAYLHEAYKHDKNVYVWQPQRFNGTYKHKATHGQLKGNLYGTPAAANIYSTQLHAHLKKHGYTQMRSDTSLFTKKSADHLIIVGISMDDFLPIATHKYLIDDLYNILQKKYTVKRLGRPRKYLNWTIRYTSRGIHISQPEHIESVVKLLSQYGCNRRTTPYLDGISMDPPSEDEDMRVDIATVYAKAVGEIRYIADSARPDIAFAATTLSRALKKPTKRHWNLLQRLTQYLHSTKEEGILMPAVNQRQVTISAYSDADFATDQTSRKSITGMISMVNGAPVQWLARQQPVVAKSTCEAEYIAASETTALTLWLHSLLTEVRLPTRKPTLHVDNTAAVQMAKSMGATKRRKCIDVRYHYLHDTVQRGRMSIMRIPSHEQYADILTKPLKATLYRHHKNNIRIHDIRDTLPSRQGECGSIQNQSQTLAQRARTSTVVPSRQGTTSDRALPLGRLHPTGE